MFGLSMGKFLILAGIILAVLFFFREAGKMKRQREELARAQARLAAEQRAQGGKPPQGEGFQGDRSQDLVLCKRCGSYVAPGAAHRCKS